MEAPPRGGPYEPDPLHWLIRRISGYASREIGPQTPLAECGLDSVAMLGLFGEIEEGFGPLLDPEDFWVYPSVGALAHQLAARRARRDADRRIRPAFVLGGPGGPHPAVTAGLHRGSAAYRTCLDRVDEALRPHVGCSVAALLRDGGPSPHRAALAPPVTFAVGYALARTLLDAGVRPVAVVGHGTGELAAAGFAGALPLAEAAALAALSGGCAPRLPGGGGMLAVCADPDEALAAAAEPAVHVGAVNAARAVVLSGRLDALARTRDALSAEGVASRLLPTGHAYHSPLMAPAVPRLRALASGTVSERPRTAYYSTVYGCRWAEPLGVDYWAAQVTSPVRFAEAVRRMLRREAPTHVVEIAPKAVLTPYVRRIGGAAGPSCFPVCDGPGSSTADLAGTLSALDARPVADGAVRR
ncbi:acyltransferase domain-containing protein [Streptomyces chrestomyceticus]|uniref:acyltransferase domain-containing protein n=1 Tax=Streptomyces chrestomyceticus TaxID=68185 RepID=UPI0035A8A1C1